MRIYFPNTHLYLYSNSSGQLLPLFPFLQLQQSLCIYSREYNVTFVFSRIWPRRLCSCTWIQVLRPVARSSFDIKGRGGLHTWSAELVGSLLPPCHPLLTSMLEHSLNLWCFFFFWVVFLFNCYYFQWFLWGKLRYEGQGQGLCWKIFSCSFDVLSCCCSQIQLS